MKKLLAFNLILLISMWIFNISAQNLPLTWSVKAGINLSNSSIDVESGLDKKAKVGFQLGVGVDYVLVDAFCLQSGLYFTTKGSKIEEKIDGIKGTVTFNQLYLQLPIMGAYKMTVAPDVRLVFSFGPHLAYGIGGKTKIKVAGIGEEKDDTFGDEGLKRFDFGLGAGVGAEFDRILVGLNYELGLVDISRGSADYKNRNASLTVGYRF